MAHIALLFAQQMGNIKVEPTLCKEQYHQPHCRLASEEVRRSSGESSRVITFQVIFLFLFLASSDHMANNVGTSKMSIMYNYLP